MCFRSSLSVFTDVYIYIYIVYILGTSAGCGLFLFIRHMFIVYVSSPSVSYLSKSSTSVFLLEHVQFLARFRVLVWLRLQPSVTDNWNVVVAEALADSSLDQPSMWPWLLQPMRAPKATPLQSGLDGPSYEIEFSEDVWRELGCLLEAYLGRVREKILAHIESMLPPGVVYLSVSSKIDRNNSQPTSHDWIAFAKLLTTDHTHISSLDLSISVLSSNYSHYKNVLRRLAWTNIDPIHILNLRRCSWTRAQTSQRPAGWVAFCLVSLRPSRSPTIV